jgi:hypothetical protein
LLIRLPYKTVRAFGFHTDGAAQRVVEQERLARDALLRDDELPSNSFTPV